MAAEKDFVLLIKQINDVMEKNINERLRGKDVTFSQLRILCEAMVEGEIESEGAVMAGQIAPLVKRIRPVAEIIDATILEC